MGFFWFLIVACVCAVLYQQKKKGAKPQGLTDRLINGNTNNSNPPPNQQRAGHTSNNDYFEELAIYTATSHVVYELSSDYGWNLSLLSFRQQEALRKLQILRQCLDIAAKTKNRDTAESNLYNAHQTYDDFCIDEFRVVGTQLLTRIKQIIDGDLLNVHTQAYVNVANAHLDKAFNAKRDNTKAKYFGLAKEVLETGLSDPFSDKEILKEMLKMTNF